MKLLAFLFSLFIVLSCSFLIVPKAQAASSLANGIAGFWKLNETGGVRSDSVGSNNLSDVNFVTSAVGRVGNAANFDETNRYLSIPDNPSLSTGDVDFTIAAWVYINSLPTTSFQDYVGKFDAASNNREYLLLYYYSAKKFAFSVSSDGTNPNTKTVTVSSPNPPLASNWYFLVAWHNSINNTLNLQVNNGKPQTLSYSSGVFDSTAPFTIGKRYSGPTAYMNGRIDAVGFWKRVLTSSERTELYNSGNGLEYPFSTTQDSIAITSPVDYRIFQRDSSSKADITVTGTYVGSPSAIEASWNNGPYSTIVSNPSGGSFSGILADQTAGQGTLTVRFTNDQTATASKNYIGIGDIFVIAGQSNAVGEGIKNQVYSNPTLKASLFGNDDKWKELVDPVDSPIGQVDSISYDSGVGGSVWPRLATYLLANQNVPVAFIPTAQGGTSIERWQKTNSTKSGGLNLYGSMARRINAVGGKIKAVLLWQGERNAMLCDASATCNQTAYKALLTTFANDVFADFGTKTVVAQIGNRDGATSVGLNNIRVAQQSAWDDGGNILPGPALYDVNLYTEFVGSGEDGTHFRSDADIQTAANRWWVAMNMDFYGGAGGRGPKVSAAQSNAARTKIAVSFTSSSLPVMPPVTSLTGFEVLDGGAQKTISSITQLIPNQLLINLESSASGTLTLSLKTSSSAPFAPWPTVPTDSSIYSLPAEVFMDMSVPTSPDQW